MRNITLASMICRIKGYAEVVPQEEVRMKTHAYTIELCASDLPMNQLFSRFSYWYHLKKVVTWILKVRNKLDGCIHPCCYDVCYGVQTLTDESLSTFMSQIEAIIYSHPITEGPRGTKPKPSTVTEGWT